MSTTIPEVTGTNIAPVTLIDLDLNGNVYYLSDAYKSLTVGSKTYTELGAFLSINNMDDNLKVTNGDLQISLSGIPSSSTGSEVNYLNIILTEPIKGGNVTVTRGFYDTSTWALESNTYVRFKGVITNFNTAEAFNFLSKQLDYSVSVSVASINSVLQNRIAGQHTDPTDRHRFFPDDDCFNRIPDIHNTPFDFGKEYTGGGGYGGGGGGGGRGRRGKEIQR